MNIITSIKPSKNWDFKELIECNWINLDMDNLIEI